MKTTGIILLALLLSACSTITVRTDNEHEAQRSPDYQERFTFWWWGLKGEYTINVREVCVGKPVEQMQTVHDIVDVAGTLFTLGIYSPRTARVWCQQPAKEA